MSPLDGIFLAMAQGGGQGASGGFASLFPLFLIFGIFYFLLIRPANQERKRHDEMLKALKKGDRVVTNGGLHGSIHALTDSIVKLRIADKTTVEINRSAVAAKIDSSAN